MFAPDPKLDAIFREIVEKSVGSSPGDVIAQQVGRWAARQLLGSAAAGGPLGLVVGGVIGGLLGGLFRRRRRPSPPPQPSQDRQVVAQSPYTVLAQELPNVQDQVNRAALTELLAQVSVGFGGNKLACGSSTGRRAPIVRPTHTAQLQQQKMQTLFNLSQLGAQDRMNRRQIAASLLDRQMQIQGQMALQKQQAQNALSSSLLGIILQQAFDGLINRR
ncbi:MAG: hypothetical protein KatS3mg087_0420 [Patescibacteria group bacterium]|nr:MAG: hypothetical protein KatS3mg087_0420 [Patescibacteria group bacterium]